MRYDIIYTIHLPKIGEVILYFDTIKPCGYNIYISGYDNDHNHIKLTLDKLVYPDSHPEECGFCHITAYAINGVTTTCNLYRSIK